MEDNIIIGKETIRRLVKDVKDIIKNPLTEHGVHYMHDETNMLKGRALILGPKNTPYENGCYLFEFNFPPNYPYSPPKLKYCTNDGTTRFNPNLYKCGKVCLSILNTWRGEQWESCQSITTVLLTLCTTLNETPLLNEPGVSKSHENYNDYNTILNYKNLEIATLDTLTNAMIINNFNMFLPIMKKNFFDNYAHNINKINNEIEKCNNKIIIKTNIYYMTITINYEELKKKFMNYYEDNKYNLALI